MISCWRELEMLQHFWLMFIFCGFGHFLAIQGFAVPPVFVTPASTPEHQPNGIDVRPPLVSSLSPLLWPSLLTSPPNRFIPSQAHNEDVVPTGSPLPSPWKPQHDPAGHPPLALQAPAPFASPTSGNKQPDSSAPVSKPPFAPDALMRPALPGNYPTTQPIQKEPPSSLPASPHLTPSPIAGLEIQGSHHYAPASYSPTEAPYPINSLWHFNGAPSPRLFSKSIPGIQSSMKRHHAKSSVPVVSPELSPSGSAPQNPKMSLRALPPPPPQEGCAPFTCTEPLTYSPPESPCVCVLPIQVGLRLTVSLYTFFPLVSILASEIAAGVFMKQSQVRIMGANAAGDDPEATIVDIHLLPFEERFDNTSAYLTFKRFWSKKVVIRASFFGDFDVLYVRYPGLPPSPPLPPSASGIIPSKPYLGHGNNGRTMQPLGVEVSTKGHQHWPSKSMLLMIILSCLVALLLMCGVLWVLIFRHQQCVLQPDPNPPTAICSLAKSSGLPVSMVRSGTSSPPFSFGSTIAACTAFAKTFSSIDIEKATEFFNETRILGEGGFGRVYNGELEDGTKVAIKILKRYDQQGDCEFLAEVEMLSRLHHRNLVKLIGICVEARMRCLVYELVPNGSVESHLHGIDKERSPLDWSARLKIALGAARALAYLHEDSSPRVIHRDFKASNILLEDDFTPKVSDFGLARAAFDEANKHISTRVMGTFGYVAPEYAMTGHLLVKSDVYSYGVVLLELLTGRKPVDMSQPPGQESLVSWARPLLTSRKDLEPIIDPSIDSHSPLDSIAKVAAIASMCVQPEVSNRPFMGEVVQALKLVCDERDETRDLAPGRCSQTAMSIAMDDRDSSCSGQLVGSMLTPCSAPENYYGANVSMSSELLSYGVQDYESFSFRRHSSSSSGALRTGKAKMFWKRMRRMSRASVSVSDHVGLFKFWSGSR